MERAPITVSELLQFMEYAKRLEDACRVIANLWPDPSCSASIQDVAGINDGKSRAIIADEAVRQARIALGMEYISYDGHISPAKP